MTTTSMWVGVGLAGQLLFTSRFLVQWIVSERRGESVIPLVFWWLSLGGGTTLLGYAIWRQDSVFFLGHGMGLVVYFRNRALIYGRREKAPA